MIKTRDLSTNKFVSGYTKNRNIIQPILGVLLISIWIIISSTAFNGLSNATKLMGNALIGLAIGYILQRSFFGFAGTVVRTEKGSPKLAYAVLIMFGLGAIIVAIMFNSNVFINSKIFNMNARPIALGTIVGSIIFGIGMVLARACASGILTDMSKGTVFVVIVIVFFVIGSGPGQMIQDYMNGKNGSPLGTGGITLIDSNALGIAGGIILTIIFLSFFAIAAYIVSKKVRQNRNLDLSKIELDLDEAEDIYLEWLKANDWSDSKDNKLFSMSVFRKFYFNFFARKWNLFLGALVLLSALVGVMLINGKGWGVTTSFARMFHWIFQVDVFNNSKDHQGILEDAGTFRNFGIAIGAIGYMLMANKFRFRRTFKGLSTTQTIATIALAATAGFLLGFGARVADGCNAGQLATGIMTFSLSSWLFAIGMVLGGIAGIYIMRYLFKKKYIK